MNTADPLGLHEFVQMVQHGFQANWPIAVVGLAGLFVLYGLVFKR